MTTIGTVLHTCVIVVAWAILQNQSSFCSVFVCAGLRAEERAGRRIYYTRTISHDVRARTRAAVPASVRSKALATSIESTILNAVRVGCPILNAAVP